MSLKNKTHIHKTKYCKRSTSLGTLGISLYSSLKATLFFGIPPPPGGPGILGTRLKTVWAGAGSFTCAIPMALKKKPMQKQPLSCVSEDPRALPSLDKGSSIQLGGKNHGEQDRKMQDGKKRTRRYKRGKEPTNQFFFCFPEARPGGSQTHRAEPLLAGEENVLLFGLRCFPWQMTKWKLQQEPVEMQCQGALVGQVFSPWRLANLFTGRAGSFAAFLAHSVDGAGCSLFIHLLLSCITNVL